MGISQALAYNPAYFGPVSGSPLIPPDGATILFFVFFALLAIGYFSLVRKTKPLERRQKAKLLFLTGIFLALFFVIGIVALAAYWVIPNPHVVKTTPVASQVKSPVAHTVEIVFDRPVKRIDLEKSISPVTPGVWAFEDPLYGTHLYRKVVFHPSVSLTPHTTYTITLTNIKNFFNASPYSYSFTFTTQDSPKVISV